MTHKIVIQNYIQNNVKPITYYPLDDATATNQYPPDAVVYNVCEDITGNGCTVNNIPVTEGNSNVNDVAHFEGNVGAGFVIGEQIQAGNSLIGKTITGLTFISFEQT